jgi:hypothetical protein
MRTVYLIIVCAIIAACSEQRAGTDTYLGPRPPLQTVSSTSMGPLYQVQSYSSPIW